MEARESLLVIAPLVLSILLCAAAAWLTLLSGPDETDTTTTNGTAPDRTPEPRVFIAGETQ